jgi:trehalose 6-phosphate phosphatase
MAQKRKRPHQPALRPQDPDPPFVRTNGDHVDIIIDAIPLDSSNAPDRDSVTPPLEFERLLGGVTPDEVLVASDFDGTLAPITDRPERARALPGALDAMHRLVPKLRRLLIVSGRANADLGRFLPIDGLELRGDYGLGDPTPGERDALDGLAGDLGALLDGLPGVWLERKPGSMSVHYRELPEAAANLERRVTGLARARGLRARGGRMVVEVMPERADKALALGAAIEALRPAAVIFAGDDTGDRGCFELVAALPVPHLAVGVRSTEAGPDLFDRCDLVVDGPAEWAELLTALADWAEASAPA